MNVALNHRELATVLAALRMWQDEGDKGDMEAEDLVDIATDGGTLEMLNDEELDALCERLNFGGSIGGRIDNAALYLRAYTGKLIRVAAMFPAEPTTDANRYMAEHPGVGLLAICNGIALLADNEDQGRKPEEVEASAA